MQRTSAKPIEALRDYLRGAHLPNHIKLWAKLDQSFIAAAEEITAKAVAEGWEREVYVDAIRSLADTYGAQGFRSAYARTWYETYVQSFGYNQAQLEMLRETPAGRLFPYLRFRTRLDDRVRPSHRRLEGITMVSTAPIWAVLRPPLDWRCRCWLQKVNWQEVRSLQLAGVIPQGDVAIQEFFAGGGSSLEVRI